jgi:hypothetical protein
MFCSEAYRKLSVHSAHICSSGSNSGFGSGAANDTAGKPSIFPKNALIKLYCNKLRAANEHQHQPQLKSTAHFSGSNLQSFLSLARGYFSFLCVCF